MPGKGGRRRLKDILVLEGKGNVLRALLDTEIWEINLTIQLNCQLTRLPWVLLILAIIYSIVLWENAYWPTD